jgi:hypothetical protein
MSYDKRKLAEYFAAIVANTTADTESIDSEAPYSLLSGGGATIKIGDRVVAKTPDDGTPTLFFLEENKGDRSLCCGRQQLTKVSTAPTIALTAIHELEMRGQ